MSIRTHAWARTSPRRPRATTTMLCTALVGVAALPAAASAAFVEPQPLPHISTVFPDRDFVSVEGYDPGEALTIRVLRNGVQIGTASGAAGPDGIFEVNHPGGACWDGSTPNILAQDKVVIAPSGSPADVGEAVTTADVHADAAVKNASGQVVITGTARNADGSPMDLGLIEQRIVNPDFLAVGIGKRDIRAVSDGSALGTLTRDTLNNPDGSKWTAVYSNLTGPQADAAVAGQTRVLAWQATNANGDRLGVTIHEVGEVGGPGFGGCPLGSDYAITGSDRPAVTKAMKDAGTSLVLSGVAQDADAVRVTLSDGTRTVARDATNLTPATGAQTWNATFTPSDLAGLADGTLTASGEYTVGGTPLTGATMTIQKDVVAPGAPGSSPGSGTYGTSQAVTLDSPDPAAKIRYTANGADPTPASTLAPAQLNITSSQVIKAIAVDPVGNTSAVSTFMFVIAAPAGTGTGTGTQSGAGAGLIPALPGLSRPAPGVAVLGAVARPLSVRSLSLPSRISITRLRLQGLGLSMRLPNGAKVVRVAIYRMRDGKRQGRAVASALRLPNASGRYVVRLRGRALRRSLRPGRYVAEVTTGRDLGDRGAIARYVFTVTR
jgi:hypothetical protein